MPFLPERRYLFDASLHRDKEGRLFLMGEVDGVGKVSLYPVQGANGGRFLTEDNCEYKIRTTADRGGFGVREQEIMRQEWGLDGLGPPPVGPTKTDEWVAPPVLHGWDLRKKSDGRVGLVGNAFGHSMRMRDPSLEEGFHIRTSAIVKIEGKIATTASGSRYLLGDPGVGVAEKIPALDAQFGGTLSEREEPWRSTVFEDTNGYNFTALHALGIGAEEFARMQTTFFNCMKEVGEPIVFDSSGRAWECRIALNGGREALGGIRRLRGMDIDNSQQSGQQWLASPPSEGRRSPGYWV